MKAKHEAVRDLYRHQGYQLMAAGFGHEGARLDLVCVRREQLAAVVVSAEPLSEEAQARAGRALRAFLAARHVSGVCVRIDRAWVADGRPQNETDAVPLAVLTGRPGD